MWAARYSTDITADLARGYSFAGWGFRPQPTPRQAWLDFAARLVYDILEAHLELDEDEALDRAIERLEDQGFFAAECEDGWLIAQAGLSAWVGRSVADALRFAVGDDRTVGDNRWGEIGEIPLYVFRCEIISDDDDGPGAARVRPTGRARRVDGLLARIRR